jgi:Holliday junction resolvase RusA-like endonuclease
VKKEKQFVFVIRGDPAVLKNHRQLGIRNGAPFSVMSKKARKFMQNGIKELSTQRMPPHPIETPVHMKILFFGPWKKNQGNMPDQSNLIQTVEDLFQDMLILADDRYVHSHDGTRRIPLCENCPERPIITRGPRKGRRKDTCGKVRNCPRACTVVQLSLFDPEETEELRKNFENILEDAEKSSRPVKDRNAGTVPTV